MNHSALWIHFESLPPQKGWQAQDMPFPLHHSPKFKEDNQNEDCAFIDFRVKACQSLSKQLRSQLLQTQAITSDIRPVFFNLSGEDFNCCFQKRIVVHAPQPPPPPNGGEQFVLDDPP